MQPFDIYTCTAQEACDYVMQKLVQQGGPCMQGSECVYDDGKGNHCAVGWLLATPPYDALLEFTGDVIELIDEFGTQIPAIIYNNRYVFAALQAIHDEGSSFSGFTVKKALNSLYADLNLLGIKTTAPQWQGWIDINVKLFA